MATLLAYPPPTYGCGHTWYLGLFTDLTNEEATQVEAITAKTKAEAAHRSKDRFLQNISHELRTLNGIMGWGSILREDISGSSTQAQL
jgi:signal transduction histidine kinase